MIAVIYALETKHLVKRIKMSSDEITCGIQIKIKNKTIIIEDDMKISRGQKGQAKFTLFYVQSAYSKYTVEDNEMVLKETVLVF